MWPWGAKAYLTQVTLTSRFLVLFAVGSATGVSRKLSRSIERAPSKTSCRKSLKDMSGVIVEP